MKQPPVPVVVVASAVLCLTTALAVSGALQTGVTTDEPVHVMRLRNLFDTGWYALDWDYDGAGPAGADSNTFVYGPVAMLVLHAWCVLWGVESWGEVATSQSAYQLRHLCVVLIGLIGVAATAAIGRVLLRSWRWGLMAAAALSAMPVWTGHTMFNIKDVPVATGYTLLTLGLVLYVGSRPPATWLRVGRAACLAVGVTLAVGTRPGMWPALLAGVAVAAGAMAWCRVPGRPRRDFVVGLGELVGALTVSAGLLIASYPNLFGDPLRAVPRTSEGSSRIGGGVEANRAYLPWHLATELPTLLGLLALAGLVIAAWRVLRTDQRVWSGRVALVAVQALALPLAAVVVGSDLYHGLRQMLFMLPAVAVFATLGVAYVISRWDIRPGWRGRLAAVTIAAALLLPAADQLTLHPYQTTYANLAADLAYSRGQPPDDVLSADYWRASLPELIEDAALDHQLLCKVFTNQRGLASHHANASAQLSTRRSVDCREEPYGPLESARLPVVRELPVTSFDAAFIGPVPPNCTPLERVRRSRHGFDVVVSTLARCRVTAHPLGVEPRRHVWRYATHGWMQWPTRNHLSAPVSEAGLTFAVESDCEELGCVLVLTGSAPSDVVATVDGHPAHVEHRDGAVHIEIPPTATHSLVAVHLSRRLDAALHVRLAGLSLVPAVSRSTERRAAKEVR